MKSTHSSVLRPLASGLFGMTLLLPATFFGLTLLARLCFGMRSMYGYMAHQKHVMVACLLVAVLFNVLAILRFRLVAGRIGPEVEVNFRRNWLNTAVVLQGTLLLAALVAYAFIEYVRY